MSATGKKSKKPSDASSERRHEEPVLFLDRSLGRHVIADALRAAGMKVQVHDDHLPKNAPVAGIDRRGRVLRYENIWDTHEPGQQF